MGNSTRGLLFACLISATLLPSLAAEPAGAAKSPPAGGKPADAAANLTAEQALVAEKFRDLEKVLIRMAELTAHTDPRRAALLRQAIAQSKQRDLEHRFDDLVNLLKQDRLAAGVKSQGEVQDDLKQLLELLLSEDRGKRLESEKQRIRDYLRRVNQIIKEQRGLQGETQNGGDEKKLASRQGELGDKTGQLGKDVDKNEGKPNASDDKGAKDQGPAKAKDPKSKDDKQAEDKSGKSQPGGPKQDGPDKEAKPKHDESAPGGKDDKSQSGKPSDGGEKSPDKSQPQSGDAQPSDGKPQNGKPQKGPSPPGQPGESSPGQQADEQAAGEDNPVRKRLAEAQERMQEARRQLDEAQRKGAAEEQQKALEALEQAKAELEAILRQLREEERSRMLAMLESRFRKMLDMQTQVYEGTKRLDGVPEKERDRDHEVECGRMSRKEAEIVSEADRALNVLHEEGSAVAFPEAVGAMREDMEQIVGRLSENKVGDITQRIEQDVIAALEEMIAALKKAQKDLADKKPQPGGQGEPTDPPLVDKIAELKVIRALQMRVNDRTRRYSDLIKSEQTADQPELLTALKRLAEREERIYKVTRDIVVGRNQ